MTKTQKDITITLVLVATVVIVVLELSYPEFFRPIGEGYLDGVQTWFGYNWNW